MFFALVIFYFIVVIRRELIIYSAHSPDIFEWFIFVGSYRWLVNLLFFYCQRFSLPHRQNVNIQYHISLHMLFYSRLWELILFHCCKTIYNLTWIVQCPWNISSICLDCQHTVSVLFSGLATVVFACLWLHFPFVFLQIHWLRLHIRENERQSRIQDCLELPVRLSNEQEKGEMSQRSLIHYLLFPYCSCLIAIKVLSM